MVVKPIKKEKKDEESSKSTQQQPQKQEQQELNVSSLSGFEFNELNRAIEVINFFENTIVPFLKKRKVDDKVIAAISGAFAMRLSNLVLRKYQLTIASINLEKAIQVLDEELPKLVKQSSGSVDAETIIKTWDMLKDLLKKMSTSISGSGGGKNG
ncbi:hypothetical protein [Saccharolobus shibatae]|uniref:Uncharacterized protein n=1 Tax=Saccharolobus shibatae TaxID=2286 RepID=A0A8F5H119_9CREN|nr:hypothetical protein [Saccharolobus shibatae]QXJ36585.1 hypothetical protein J5U22_03162 [Saccharolobus shibatae]